MIHRILAHLETAVETFINAVLDRLIAAWVEAEE